MRNRRKYAATLGSVMAVGGLLGGVGCSGSTETNPGALVIAVQTDLTAPKDVTAVGLYISSDGRPIFSDTRDTAPDGDVHFPATLAVIADSAHPSAVVKIRAVAYTSDNKVRVLRDAITTVPSGRSALLRMPLLWINSGSGTGTRPDKSTVDSLRIADLSLDQLSGVQGTCPNATDTYLVGTCGPAAVDSSTLPDYLEADVFGGGSSDGTGGSCFDAKSCFESSTTLKLDANCSAPLPSGVVADDPSFSLGVAVPEAPAAGEKTAGACLGNGSCVVALDPVVEWNVVGGIIQVAPAICTRIENRAALGVLATRACPSKSEATPLCGPASSVQMSSSDDAGNVVAPPFDFDGAVSMTMSGADSGGDADVRDASEPGDATLTSDADTGDATMTMADGSAGSGDGGSTSSDGGGSSDGASDSGHVTTDAGDGGVNTDAAAPPNGDFGAVTTFSIGVPGANNLQTDGSLLYVGEATGAQAANVVSFALAGFSMTPPVPGAGFSYFNMTDAPATSPAPVYGIWGNAKLGGITAVFGNNGMLRDYNCPIMGAGCITDTQLTGIAPMTVRDVAVTPSRLYTIDGTTSTVYVYNFAGAPAAWSSFTVGATATAIHYITSTNQLVIGESNGNLAECTDSPCTMPMGLAYSGTPGSPVSGITDDGTNLAWAVRNTGIFRYDGMTVHALVSGALIANTVTPLAMDVAANETNPTYLYFGDANQLEAVRIDGSTNPSQPKVLAPLAVPVTSIVSAGPEVYFAAPSAGNASISGLCKEYESPGCP